MSSCWPVVYTIGALVALAATIPAVFLIINLARAFGAHLRGTKKAQSEYLFRALFAALFLFINLFFGLAIVVDLGTECGKTNGQLLIYRPADPSNDVVIVRYIDSLKLKRYLHERDTARSFWVHHSQRDDKKGFLTAAGGYQFRCSFFINGNKNEAFPRQKISVFSNSPFCVNRRPLGGQMRYGPTSIPVRRWERSSKLPPVNKSTDIFKRSRAHIPDGEIKRLCVKNTMQVRLIRTVPEAVNMNGNIRPHSKVTLKPEQIHLLFQQFNLFGRSGFSLAQQLDLPESSVGEGTGNNRNCPASNETPVEIAVKPDQPVPNRYYHVQNRHHLSLAAADTRAGADMAPLGVEVTS